MSANVDDKCMLFDKYCLTTLVIGFCLHPGAMPQGSKVAGRSAVSSAVRRGVFVVSHRCRLSFQGTCPTWCTPG